MADVKGIADLMEQEHLHSNYILPHIDDPRILVTLSDKLREVIRLHVDEKEMMEHHVLILCISSQIRLIVGGSPLIVSSKRFESSR